MLKRLLIGTIVFALALAVFVGAAVPVAAKGDFPPGFPCKESYVVRSGDTMATIAAKAGTPALWIIKMNSIADPAFLLPGTKLCVKYYVVAGTFVTVNVGDTLTTIADDFDKDPDYLAAVNDISDPNAVYQGYVVFVPRSQKYFPD